MYRTDRHTDGQDPQCGLSRRVNGNSNKMMKLCLYASARLDQVLRRVYRATEIKLMRLNKLNTHFN